MYVPKKKKKRGGGFQSRSFFPIPPLPPNLFHGIKSSPHGRRRSRSKPPRSTQAPNLPFTAPTALPLPTPTMPPRRGVCT